MSAKKQPTRTESARRESYLKLPYYILNLPSLGPGEKILLAHIYSFGSKGCWQSNKTLARMFMTSERNLSRWVNNLKPFIYIRNPKGYYRTIWAKSYYDKNGEHPRQNKYSDCDKNGIRLRQKCPTTNINTIIENNNKTTATPSPLPACGQAPALLEHRKQQVLAGVSRFKRNFGKPQCQPMPEQEFEQRRAALIKALLATQKDRQKTIDHTEGVKDGQDKKTN